MQHLKTLKQILQYNKLFLIIILLLIISLIIQFLFRDNNSIYNGNEKTIVGKIVNYNINGDLLKIDVENKEIIKVDYYIKTEKEKKFLEKEVCLGCTIRLNGTIKKVLDNTIPNNFNYKRYLNNKEIYYKFLADKIIIVHNNSFIYKIKDSIIKKIYRTRNKDYLLVFILGNKSLINSNEYNILKDNGVAHLLAISGMHLGLIIFILNKGFYFIKSKYKNILIIIVLFFVGFMTGFTPSVKRVIFFFILNIINKELKLNYSNIMILFMTVAIELMLNYKTVLDVSFIYSHIITFGIMYYHDKISGKYLFKLIKLSIISFLFSLPITARLNYEINITSILANLICVPLVSFIVFPLAIINVIVPNNLFSISLNIFIYLSKIIYKYKLMINIPKMSLLFILIYYLLLIIYKNKNKKICLILIILLMNKIIYKLDNDYHVYFFDVGQGDCSLLVTPYKKKVIMIDTGGRIKIPKKAWQQSTKENHLSDNVIKFMKSIAITKIDYLVITHGDFDHIGEGKNITNNIKVKNVIFNNGKYNKLELDLIKDLKNRKINYLQNIKSLNLDNFKLEILNTRLYNNENEDSIVIYTVINNLKLLLMGDAGILKEMDLLNKYNLNNIDILKVGHHGSSSASSTDFISHIRPKTCIISVGLNNRYGHPTKEVIDTLDDYCNIYRTDINGSIGINLSKVKIMEVK